MRALVRMKLGADSVAIVRGRGSVEGHDFGDLRRTLGEQQHLVRKVHRVLEIVRDHDHRRARLHEHVLQLFPDEQRHFEIQRGKRLVEKQHFRFGRQRAHDRRCLLLPARQFVRIAHQVELDVERRDQLLDALCDLLRRASRELERVADVVDRAHPRETSHRDSSGTRSRSWSRAAICRRTGSARCRWGSARRSC